MALPTLQRWFQSEVTRPNERPRRAAPRGYPPAEAVIRPSASLRAPERLAVYTRMYWWRLADVLAEDFPTVRHLAGEPAWKRLCRRYLTVRPSRHWSLSVLGAGLPDFLARPRPWPRRALLRDVARLEWALQEVFDAPRCAELSPEAFGALAPGSWERARLRPQAASRLLALGHPAYDCVEAVKEGRPLPRLGRRRTWVVVWRHRGRAWRRALTGPMHAGLASLARGATVGGAVRAIARAWDGPAHALQASVFEWFQTWAADGLFGEVV